MADEERRRYFRIYDDFRVCYRIAADLDHDPTERPTSDSHRLKLLISRIAGVSQDVADALAVIDKRLMALEQGVPSGNEHTAQGINISACGVAFVSESQLPLGTPLDITLYLDKASLVLNALGRIVGSEVAVAHPGAFMMRADFERMNPDERELLIQYVLRRQGEQLRHRAIG